MQSDCRREDDWTNCYFICLTVREKRQNDEGKKRSFSSFFLVAQRTKRKNHFCSTSHFVFRYFVGVFFSAFFSFVFVHFTNRFSWLTAVFFFFRILLFAHITLYVSTEKIAFAHKILSRTFPWNKRFFFSRLCCTQLIVLCICTSFCVVCLHLFIWL